jgi:uncharacterized coiled-coil protein SlyX
MAISSIRAAARVGKTRLVRAITTGKLSVIAAGKESESTARVYPFPAVIAKSDDSHFPQNPIELATRLATLEAEIRGLKDILVEVKASRDQWRDQVVRLTSALPAPGQRSWWRRLAG